MQQDVTSLPARRFQQALKKWHPEPGSRAAKVVEEILAWDAVLGAESRPALIYEVWISKLPAAMAGAGSRGDLESLLRAIETEPSGPALQKSLDTTLEQLDRQFGADPAGWQWGKAHTLTLAYPLASLIVQAQAPDPSGAPAG